jgi:Flp pilus assembly protein TadG
MKKKLTGQRGAVLIFVALVLFLLLGFAAFALDFGYTYVVKSQLQNAADAAALAGASVLFSANENCISVGSPYSCCSGSGTGSCSPSVIDSTNVVETGRAVAALNNSTGNPVPVPTVEIGHFAFSSSKASPGTFTAASSPPVQMTGWETQSFSALNANTSFINAVRATVSRTDVPRFFSRIWSSSDLAVTAEATAYIGFAGYLVPSSSDLPISICKQAIMDGNSYSCNRGRMINSGTNSGGETGGWTNYDQPASEGGSCTKPTKNDIPLSKNSCSGGNVKPIRLGIGMGLTNGEIQTTYDDGLIHCWVTSAGGSGFWQGNTFKITKWPDKIWTVRLPVVDCSSGVSNCSDVVGLVTVNIVWMTRTGTNSYDDVPKKMGDWTCPAGYTNQQCWTDFVNYFKLKQSLGDTPATFYDKTIYFMPDCEPHIPSGNTGGENFGILAKNPVLVK